jgi:hypothetical protein
MGWKLAGLFRTAQTSRHGEASCNQHLTARVIECGRLGYRFKISAIFLK